MVASDPNYNSSYYGAGPTHRRWKGKAREVTEGSGGQDGVVIPLTMTGSGFLDVAYTVPVRLGGSKELLLQVDTGSSDLWVVSSSCSSKLCKQAGGNVYDPSSSTSTGQDFEIKYILGSVKGPIVWDEVELGGYTISNQALAAATEVLDEPISSSFNGILGLALPRNSIIASQLTTTTSDSPDGAALAANLFGITPPESSPGANFYSLSLSRPDSKKPSALLSIGRHPAEFVSSDEDEARIKYISLLSERTGTLFWKTGVRDISVWVNGEQHTIDMGQSGTGSAFPSAIIDSGVPLLLTTSKIANAIYGAINVQPASDGKYYVPCTTPLNMSMTFENDTIVPLHPLDLTTYPSQGAQDSTSCVGLIQAADGFLGSARSIADFILGVPFMRNAYTVMAYEQPEADGSFSDSTHRAPIRPALGLLPLTDPTKALDEFNTIRVLNRPLPDSPSGGNTNKGTSAASESKGGISVGIGVLIGVLSFFGLCTILFGIRWWITRRKWQRSNQEIRDFNEKSFFGGLALGGASSKKEGGAYELTARSEDDAEMLDAATLTEDQLRQQRHQAYLARQNHPQPDEFGALPVPQRRMPKRYLSDDTNLTRVQSMLYDDPWDPATAIGWGDGMPSKDPTKHVSVDSIHIHADRPPSGREFGALHDRTSSYSTAPLLAQRESMAGIGTAAARASMIHPDTPS